MEIDYQKPDYTAIFRRRAAMLRRLRTPEGRDKLPGLKAHYRNNPIQFITDWGITSDPRNIERGLPAVIPFVPFLRQVEWLEWLLAKWRGSEGGLTEKSRDMGCSVLAMSLFGALSLFNRDFVAGVGSRKEMLVDRVGDPNTLFFKLRMFLRHVPEEFRGGWYDGDKRNDAHMKVSIPDTGSVIIGEAGNNIGRGGRTSIYLIDEAAFLQNPMSVEASISQTTRCRIDLSSSNGSANPFAEKRFSGRVDVFTFHWRDDPRKNDAWYKAETDRLPPVIVAQEIDINYNASKEHILIPSEWVQAAVDAHLKLGAVADSTRHGALDVADEGDDKNAFAARHGVILDYLEEWSGKGSDIFATSERASALCDSLALVKFRYDADGLGVGVRGDMRIINGRENRKDAQIEAVEHRGSGKVVDPEGYVIAPDIKHGHKGRTNEDFFANYKAQSWWHLRTRFENTYKRLVTGLDDVPTEDCVVLPKRLPHLNKLIMELSQPTYSINTQGKISVDKKPEGAKSPNLADAVVIAFAPEAPKRRGILDFD